MIDTTPIKDRTVTSSNLLEIERKPVKEGNEAHKQYGNHKPVAYCLRVDTPRGDMWRRVYSDGRLYIRYRGRRYYLSIELSERLII